MSQSSTSLASLDMSRTAEEYIDYCSISILLVAPTAPRGYYSARQSIYRATLGRGVSNHDGKWVLCDHRENHNRIKIVTLRDYAKMN